MFSSLYANQQQVTDSAGAVCLSMVKTITLLSVFYLPVLILHVTPKSWWVGFIFLAALWFGLHAATRRSRGRLIVFAIIQTFLLVGFTSFFVTSKTFNFKEVFAASAVGMLLSLAKLILIPIVIALQAHTIIISACLARLLAQMPHWTTEIQSQTSDIEAQEENSTPQDEPQEEETPHVEAPSVTPMFVSAPFPQASTPYNYIYGQPGMPQFIPVFMDANGNPIVPMSPHLPSPAVHQNL